MIVAAWGRVNPPAAKRVDAKARIAYLIRMIEGDGGQLYALGVNKDGSPKHPLYVRGDTQPLPWTISWDSHVL